MKPHPYTEPDMNWQTRENARKVSEALADARHARNVRLQGLVAWAGMLLVVAVILAHLAQRTGLLQSFNR